jgi:hypothetical protein
MDLVDARALRDKARQQNNVVLDVALGRKAPIDFAEHGLYDYRRTPRERKQSIRDAFESDSRPGHEAEKILAARVELGPYDEALVARAAFEKSGNPEVEESRRIGDEDEGGLTEDLRTRSPKAGAKLENLAKTGRKGRLAIARNADVADDLGRPCLGVGSIQKIVELVLEGRGREALASAGEGKYLAIRTIEGTLFSLGE